MARVLRPAGKMGVMAWSKGVNKMDQVWHNIANKFVTIDLVGDALQQALPSEKWLSNPDNIKNALRDICLEDIEVKHKDYKIRREVQQSGMTPRKYKIRWGISLLNYFGIMRAL